jgi:hypothetical protein
MTAPVDRPPCPICGEPRCILVRCKQLGQTCGKGSCAAKVRAQRLGSDHYRKLTALARSKRKPKQRTPEQQTAYNSGLTRGLRTGFKQGYAAAKAEMENGSHGG